MSRHRHKLNTWKEGRGIGDRDGGKTYLTVKSVGGVSIVELSLLWTSSFGGGFDRVNLSLEGIKFDLSEGEGGNPIEWKHGFKSRNPK